MKFTYTCSWSVMTLFLCLLNTAKMEFDVHPSSSSTPLGANASFTCQTASSSASQTSWIVVNLSGDRLDTVLPDERSELETRGIFLQTSDTQLSLIVLASLENNGTSVRCREVRFPFQPSFSDAAVLTVIGPPLSPVLTIRTVQANKLVLEWQEPFTWPGHDVLGYNIEVASPDGSIRSYNTSSLSHTYMSSLTEGERQACALLTFKVSAVSDIGRSEPSILATGLPNDPAEMGDITSEVTFQQNGIPVVTLNLLQPPLICDYQTAELILEVRRLENGTPLPAVVEDYSSQSDHLSISYITGLVANSNYSSTITLSTVLGNISTTVLFNTTIYQATPSSPHSCHSRDLLVGAISGSICLVLTSIIILLLAALFFKHRHSKRIAIASEVGVTSYNNQFSKEKLSMNHYTT